jgi:hypothetical protein
MTEQVGATAIADPPLPRDAAGAAALRESLTSNADYMKDWKSDQGKQNTLAYLRFVAGGNDPDRWGKSETESDVRAQMTDRDKEIHEARLDAFARHTRMTPEIRHEFSRRLATQEQHDFAVAERERLLKDKAFGRRVHVDHDAEAIDRWIKVVQAAAAPVAPPDFDWSK